MEIDITYGGNSLEIELPDPHRLDAADVSSRVAEFLDANGAKGADALHLEELFPRMVRGIVGCEQGCPADAQRLVHEGFHDYSLQYVEGGILKASLEVFDGERLEIRMFPEF